MGTLTAECPRLDAHCPHKLATSCRLTSTLNCCACADERAHSRTYRVYIDGIGFVQRGTRWQGYCWFCKEFWTNRLAATDPPLETSQTRIPEIPDQSEFLNRWFEFHQGYRVAKLQDGTEQRMPVIGEPFKEVSPGFLPRTMDQLRQGVENDARRPENRLRRRRLTSEEARPQEPQQDIDSVLDELLAQASDDEIAQAPPSTATPQPTIPQPPVFRARPLNRGEARLQRARERFARVFGSPEDMQQDDYESPLSTMYNRAENRYLQAEERRASDTTAPPPLNGLSAQEQREIEDQLLWGVMRESANDAEPEENVWSYTPRRLQLAPPPRLHTTSVDYGRARTDQTYPRLLTGPVLDMALETALRQDLRARDSARATTNAASTRYPIAFSVPTAAEPTQSGISSTSSPSPQTSAGASPASMAVLLRHQARYEAMLADRMAEFERLRPEPQPADDTSREYPSDAENTRDASQATAPTLSSSSPDGSNNGMSQIQASIQQITSELHRLRLASEAITSARHSMHSHFQQQPERTAQTLDNQPGRPAAMSEEDMTRKIDCQVCYQQLADIALLPCGHMVMCQWCADVVIPVKHTHLPIRPSKCPMCRKTVKQRFKIHMG
ncbi:hypothetical protein BDU57DRAFT_527954 [Ampelomyces quisqualis]|uniref:RING-type domain-containing protein n=1 Tax=Ampelomyces quisqualis TaxID=50730 RepID=A0A6A5QR50_AMPQU|nr:hypothetical protein BDU57DRAFT_527954 [Ampelomyces quisqualis]